MLFDLRGRGRRSTIKIIYVTLAILMGGGLVLFGIGGDVSGGLVDAITERGGGSGDNSNEEQLKKAEAAARARPADPVVWSELARRRYLEATSGYERATGQFNDDGKAKLRPAVAAWQKHLQLAGDKPNDSVASLMILAYSEGGLNEPDKAVQAQEVIAEARPKTANYAVLAQLAYEAGQTRKGDLASEKAVELADKDQQEAIKAELESIKSQAQQKQIQEAQPSPTPTLGAGG